MPSRWRGGSRIGPRCGHTLEGAATVTGEQRRALTGGQPPAAAVGEDAEFLVEHDGDHARVGGQPECLTDRQGAAVVGGRLPGAPFQIVELDGDDQLRGQPGLAWQLARVEQHTAGSLESVVPALPDRPGVRTELVGLALRGEWGERGLPDRSAGRGEQALDPDGVVRSRAERQATHRGLAAFGRCGAVRVEVGQDALAELLQGARIVLGRQFDQGRFHVRGVLDPGSGRQRLDDISNHTRVVTTQPTGGERLGGQGVKRFEGRTGQRPPRGKPRHLLRDPLRRTAGNGQLGLDQVRQPPQSQALETTGIQLGEHRKLPVLQRDQLTLQLPHRRTQLGPREVAQP